LSKIEQQATRTDSVQTIGPEHQPIALQQAPINPRPCARELLEHFLDFSQKGASKPIKRFLDPMERISEILFGVVMVLTITCSFSVGAHGRTEVHQMLIGALGCNVAWGVIDAVLHWLACFHAHGLRIMTLRVAREAKNPEEAYRVIAEALPPLLASVTTSAELEAIRQKLQQLPEPAQRPHLTKDEWLAGLGVFLLVVVATLPVVLPFLFVYDPTRALRISNSIAILLLFLIGYVYGYHTGHRPLRSGLIMIVIGAAMVGMTIALGG
jgi:hypothetical protein